jgi:PD-(D/E)XK endonuclease
VTEESNADLYLHSSLREGLLEHLFVGQIMRDLWLRGARDFEVLRPTTDAAGYDVVLAANGVIRHVQLKSSAIAGKTARQKINTALGRQPSGCVVWMRFDPVSLSLGPFHWFGGQPGQPLPDLGDRIGKHTKGNAEGIKAERKSIRILHKGEFETVHELSQVTDRLFGSSIG